MRIKERTAKHSLSIAMVMGFGFLALLFVFWPPTPEPTEISQAEIWIDDGVGEEEFFKAVDGIKIIFNPETHYVVSVDTVGWMADSNLYLTDIRYDYRTDERIEIKHRQPIDWESWGGVDSVISRSKPCNIEWEYVVRPILDSIIAPKQHFLVTPEEAAYLRDFLRTDDTLLYLKVTE